MKRLMSKVCGAAILSMLVAGGVFAEDAYIESTEAGGQYIDTGLKLDYQSCIVFDYAATTTTESYLFGIGGGEAGYLSFGGFVTQEKGIGYNCQDSEANVSYAGIPASFSRYKIVLDAKNNLFAVVDENGVTNKALTISAKHTTAMKHSLLLMANRWGGDGVVFRKKAMRLYGCQIYQNGQLVRDYVPCVRGGVAGLKDLVGGEFKMSAVDTPFEYGGDIRVEKGDGYIESTEEGGQYIDTGLTLDYRSCIVFDYAATTENGVYLFGTGGQEEEGYLSLGGFVTASEGIGYNCQDNKANTGYTYISASLLRRKLVLDAKNNFFAVVNANGVTNKVLTINATHTTAMKYTLLLMAHRWNGGSGVFSKKAMRLYGCQIYQDGRLIRDFVPCISAGIVGLKDRVGGSFVTAATCCRFDYGGDILEDAGDGYIESTALGKQYIDTGLTMNSQSCVEFDYATTTTTGDYLFGNGGGAAGYLSFGGISLANNATYGVGYNCRDDSANVTTVGVPSSFSRRKVILDAKNSRFTVLTADDATNIVANIGHTHTTAMKYSLLLMANRWAGNSGYQAAKPMRLYGCRIRQNGELVRDYVPFVTNGVPGLKDQVDGGFVTFASKNALFACGGRIQTDGADDAYLESDGSQVLDTGFVPTKDTKIVCDYQLLDMTNKQARVFGAKSNRMCAQFYVQDDLAGLAVGYNGAESPKTVGSVVAGDLARHTLTLDLQNGTCEADGVVKTLETLAEGVDSAKNASLALFGQKNWTTPYELQSHVRIYSFKIYENGDLQHHFLPYRCGDVVGMKDVVTGDVLTDERQSAMPFRIGGCGADGEAFAVSPADTTVPCKETATLSAFAPGALSYQWYVDGVVLPGETNMTCTVDWVRLGDPREYFVKARFDVYGDVREESSATATVLNAKRGLMIIFR